MEREGGEMEKRILYGEAYTFIARYANDLLPLFADRWERWPIGYNAITLVDALCSKKDMYYDMDMKDEAEKCSEIGAEIIMRAER
jgi:hypothetical protein